MKRYQRLAAPALACAMVLCGFATGAWAQGLGGDLAADAAAKGNFARDRNVAVRERPHTGYEAPAHRLGAFVAQVTVGASGEYNDNIYAATGKLAHDYVGRLAPRVDLVSTWSRHELSAFAQASVNRYAKHSTENTTDWSLGSSGRLDIVRGTSVSAGVDTGRYTEPRTGSSTQILSATPIRFDQTNAFLSVVREVNRIRLSARGDWKDYNYMAGRSITGVSVFEDDRDRQAKSLLGRADYAISPATAVFAELSGNWRDYSLNPPRVPISRNSHGYEALAGANFDISNLIRGELAAGYLSQKFQDARFGSIGGFGMRGQVAWFPTQLTTVSTTLSRTVEDAGVAGASGYLSTNLTGQIDHELLRNLIVSANGSYGHDDYRGIARTDRRVGAGVSATYLMNRAVGLNLAYSYYDQSSKGAAGGLPFTVNRVILTLTGHI